jgi:hypothetical protein
MLPHHSLNVGGVRRDGKEIQCHQVDAETGAKDGVQQTKEDAEHQNSTSCSAEKRVREASQPNDRGMSL